MLPNSDHMICSTEQKQLKPLSKLLKLDLVPFSFLRQTNHSFYYCDVKDNMTTNVINLKFDKDGSVMCKDLQEFMGIYQYSCFGDEHAFLMNKEGDIIYYDLITKDSFFVQRQHPSPFNPVQIHNIGQHFITCGGNIKGNVSQNQKIIKLWHYENDQLASKARIVTGHQKPIQNSLVMGQNKMVTLSTDKTVRVANLATQQLEQVARTNKDFYSGCQFDWNSVLLGGHSQYLDILDIRSKKLISSQVLNIPVLQICEMIRINHNELLIANVNTIYSLDLRTFQLQEKGKYDGERISIIKVLSADTLILGNRDKTMQIWSFC